MSDPAETLARIAHRVGLPDASDLAAIEARVFTRFPVPPELQPRVDAAYDLIDTDPVAASGAIDMLATDLPGGDANPEIVRMRAALVFAGAGTTSTYPPLPPVTLDSIRAALDEIGPVPKEEADAWIRETTGFGPITWSGTWTWPGEDIMTVRRAKD